MNKLTSSMILLGFAAVISAACQGAYAIDANALPTVVGSVNVENSINNATNTMTSKVIGGTGTVGQNDMTGGLGSNSTWNINASAHSQTFIGRFVDGNLTELNGKINTGCANGVCNYGDTLKVILTNPYGISFGAGSQVNANSFTVSTFNPTGAKDISTMSATELAAYKAGLTNQFGPNVNINFEGGANTNGAAVTLNNSTWNIDKTAAIIAKDINMYNGSKISTNLAYNYGSPANQNFSNIKLVTSDGVNFTYKANGYLDNNKATVLDGKAGVDYTIKVGDKKEAGVIDATLSSGSVQVVNKGKTDASTTKVANALVKGYKLINNAYGDIYLVGDSVSVDNSLLETYNTHETATPSNNTYDKKGGTVTVKANKGIDINNSTINTAYSTADETAGDVTLEAGNLNIKKSTINSQGSVWATSTGDTNITDSIISAKNSGAGLKENAYIYGGKNVNVTNSNVEATNILAQAQTGDVNLVKNGKIKAGENLNIIGKNTLVEGSALSYNKIALNDGTNNNNVTIKGTTTLQDNGSPDKLVLDVKGNLTVDNASLKTRTPGTAYADAKNQKAIALNATGDITIQNNSDVTSDLGTTVNAANNINVKNSKLTANNNNNELIAAAGKVNLEKATLKAKANNKVNAKVDVDSECSDLDAANNTVVASTGKVSLSNSKLTATAANNVTAKTDIKTSNVRIKGANNNVIASTGNADIVNTDMVATGKNTVKADKGNVTFKYDEALATACAGGTCVEVVTKNQVKGTDNEITAEEGNITIQGADVIATNNNKITTPKGSIRLEKVTVKADKDNEVVAADDVDTECATLDAENNTVTAQNGKIAMSNTLAKAKKANNVTANKNINTANVRIAGANNKVNSKVGDIEITNTDLKATVKNTVKADKGNVTFKYDEALASVCTGNGCIDVVTKNNIEGPDNEVTADKNVDIDTTITPNDPTKPEDTKTTITAGGDITTGARVIYDDLYDKTGTIVGKGSLDTQGTQLKINTPGNINLVLKNTNNPKAGLDLKGNKVEMKTRDGELSIAKIYANELYLDKDEKFIAGKTTITASEKAIDSFAASNPEELSTQAGFDANLPGRAYIEVKDGFNFDYEPAKVAVGGMYQGSFNEVKDAEGNIIGYGKHYITLDENTTEGQFLLTYKKPFACDPLPVVDPDVDPITPIDDAGYLTDQTALTRIPLQSDMFGNADAISNGITDTSVSMIAAAAAVDVDDEEQLDY